MAGGDNGKTELWNGWTWAAAILDSHHAAQELARRLTVEIEQWVGAPASIASESFRPPDDPRDEWFLLPYDRYLTVYVPFHRENCFPWDVHDECYWRQPLEHG